MKRTVRSSLFEVSMRDDGIIFARAFPNSEVNVEAALEYHSMVAYVADGKKNIAPL